MIFYISIGVNLILMAVIIVLLASLHKRDEWHSRFVDLLYKDFDEERQRLLDRIQAPTFGEYKQAEIRMVKAQKDEEPKPSFVLE
jgi:hypothetical protein